MWKNKQKKNTRDLVTKTDIQNYDNPLSVPYQEYP